MVQCHVCNDLCAAGTVTGTPYMDRGTIGQKGGGVD